MAKPRREPAGLALRQAATGRLQTVLEGADFAPFSAFEIDEPRDRALANRLVTTALRRHGHLDSIAGRFLDRGMPRKSGSFEAVLRLSLAQLLYLPELGDHSALFLAGEAMRRDPKGQHLQKLMNAVLRRTQAEAESLRALPLPLLLPEPMRDRWTAQYGGNVVEAFATALLDTPPLDLTLKQPDGGLVDALDAVPVLGDTVRLLRRDRAVADLPGYAEGAWWVQDAAAAIPARLLRLPTAGRVLDLCAAPGGKTAQLVKAGHVVTALDNDAERLERLRANLDRLGYRAEIVCADAATYHPEAGFDGILLDAPCTATGTFRRHPEVLWHRSAADLAGRVALQRRLLAAAAACLNPGGVLVYCVCSLEAAEGEEQATWAAAAGLELLPDPIAADELPGLADAVLAPGVVRTHPGLAVRAGIEPVGTLDGFFVARFRRRQ